MNKFKSSSLNRRQFLHGAGAGVALFSILPGCATRGGRRISQNDKLNVAGIGIGSRGGSDVDEVAGLGDNIVALCDVDETYAAKEFAKYPNAKRFTDYRVMLDKMGKEIDGVVIGTPDHTHAIIAMEAMRRGKHVYCEKPLAHSIHEVRELMSAADKYKVVTQLGNQGHSSDTIRRLCEWVWAGAIGQVHTVHAGCDAFKNVYCQIPNLEKAKQTYEVPKGLDYELWIGPVPFRPYTPLWVPWNWRGWMPFGGGAIGDWICHVVDPTFWALNLDAPTTVLAEVTDYDPVVQGLSYPAATKISFEFAARQARGPVKLIWYDGNNTIPKPKDFPADEKIPGTGAIIVGEKGMIVHGSHGGGGCHLVPDSLMEQYSGKNAPAQKITRVKGHAWDWADAIRSGRKAGSNFGYGGPLTQVALLGLIAIRFPGQTLKWDDRAMRFTNNDAANAYINPAYRPGWETLSLSVQLGVLGFSESLILGAAMLVWVSQTKAQTAADSVDHAALIQKWDASSLTRGEKLYAAVCITCHGTPEKSGTLPTSRAFWKEPFKNGSDPFSLYQTIGAGTNQMPPQLWMTPEQRYDVVHFIRETFLKPLNPAQYFAVTSEYLATLPKGAHGVFQKTAEMLDYERGPKYLRMDFGPALFWTYEVAPNNFAYKGIAIRLDEGPEGISRGRAWMVFDHDTMRWAAGWTGDKFIDWKGIALDGSHETHASIVGNKSFINPVGPGWANPATGNFDDPRQLGKDQKPYGPLPREWAHYQGHWRDGDNVIVTYSVGDAEVMELAGIERSGGVAVFSRTLDITKSRHDLLARLAPDTVPAFLVGPSPAKIIRDQGMSLLQIPVASTPLRVKVILGDPGPGVDPNVVYGFAVSSKPALDLFAREKLATPPLPSIETQGKIGSSDGAFAVDEITVPTETQMPGHSWMRLSGFDFFKDGQTAAVCTWNGDVWLVKGINATLDKLTWQRIATGLFQPLGLKIVDERIYVGCRDQIVRLHDDNGDGAVDFIENFNNDHQVTEHFHEFATGLQTDPEGNFYYAKCGRHGFPAVVPQHGTVLKVSPDGRNTRILAHGFRAINGLCVNDDGTCLVTDQEGHWTPKNRIDWVRPGKFYGYMWAYDHPESAADEAMSPPLAWIVNEMDRSPAEIVRIPKGNWGALEGSLLNISYGTGQIYLVPNEPAGPELQGGVVALPLPLFPTGIMRGRFNPQDGQLYTCGLFGWAGNRTADGGFFRVRYTGKPSYLPVGIHATPQGVQLTFTDALDAATAQDAKNYGVATWGLKRTENYGSPRVGEKTLSVKSARLSGDGKIVSLEILGIQPTWCMEIKIAIRGADGTPIHRQIQNTIHTLN